jgi:hypothetical protein
MKGAKIVYSPEELRWIEARKTYPRTILHAAFVIAFGRADITVENIKSLCTRKGWKTGRTGCFPKGNTPVNKGRKGYCAPGSEKGWFRKGERRGVATKLYKPIGTERMAKGGYLERKINDDLPLQRRWRAVHLINWEVKHGPIPAGHALKCLDGNKLNTDPGNWELIPRALLPRLAGAKKGLNFDHAPDELRVALMATARLEHQVRVIRRAQQAESN